MKRIAERRDLNKAIMFLRMNWDLIVQNGEHVESDDECDSVN